jgi:Holliday junction resolvasome RuvABC ATP-dependent DNA helicase subunit
MHVPRFTFIPMVKLVSNYASFELREVFRNAFLTQNATAQYYQEHVIQNSGLDTVKRYYLTEVTRLSTITYTGVCTLSLSLSLTHTHTHLMQHFQ